MRIKRINFTMALILMMAILIVLPTQVLSRGKPNPDQPLPDPPTTGVCAEEPPDGDFDGDGFTNDQECNGINEEPGIVAFSYPSCTQQPDPREGCLDPESKDLFVWLITLDQGSLIEEIANETDPLRYVNCSQNDPNCLGIVTHLVGDGTGYIPFVDRSIIAGGQKAVRVTESSEIVDQFGESWHGTPLTGKDEAQIYTYRIKDFVNSTIGGDNPLVWKPNILHTLAHEIGHMVNLWIEYNDRYGGWHLRSGTYKIMEQSVKVQGTTFFISDQYDDSSIGGFALH